VIKIRIVTGHLGIEHIALRRQRIVVHGFPIREGREELEPMAESFV
jgi:hypothetical protein